jgi:hypothetical protein
MSNIFKKAERAAAKSRVAIAGISGSGKTWTGLIAAHVLAGPDGKVAVLDTEHGASQKYAGEVDERLSRPFEFDVAPMEPPFHPERYVQAIEYAVDAGYDALVIDSLSHAWDGLGGILDLHDKFSKKRGDSFSAWRDVNPIQNALINAILSADLHIIGTMRSKKEYIVSQNDKGRTTIKKAGTKPTQRDDFEYEFDVYTVMDIDHNLIVEKTRCPALDLGVYAKPGPELWGVVKEWLGG